MSDVPGAAIAPLAMALSDVNETLTAVGGLAGGLAAIAIAWFTYRDRHRRRGNEGTPPPRTPNSQ